MLRNVVCLWLLLTAAACSQTVQVNDTAGFPVEGASVALQRFSIAVREEVGTTDEHGRVRFWNMTQPAIEVVFVTKSGYASAWLPGNSDEFVFVLREVSDFAEGGEQTVGDG